MQHAISQTETKSNANVRMPIDVNGWRAGTADTKYCYFLHVKQQSNSTFSDYAISILRIFIYLYVFIISSLATGPLSVCAAVILNVFRFEKLSLSPWSNKNTLISSCSLNAKFASLTEHTQATIYFLLYVIKLGLTSVICRVFYIFIPALKEMFGSKIILIRFYKIILSCIIMLVCGFKVYNLYYFCIKHTLSVMSTRTPAHLLIV